MPTKTFFYSRTGKLITTVASCCLLLLGLLWMQVVNQRQTDRQHTIDEAVQRNANLAVSLEEHTITTLRNADAVLQLVKKEYDEYGTKFDFQDLYSRGVIDTTYFNGVAIMDKAGKLLVSDLHGLKKSELDFSDRDYFVFQKTHHDQLYISKPLLSRTIYKTVIVISRRITNKDGSFGGIVSVQVLPATFTDFYAKANLRRKDIISLIAPDGITYARRTGTVESQGEDISRSPLFGYVANEPIGHYYARDALHNIPTYFSYRKLAAYPVIATVGSAEKDILADYRLRTRREYIFTSVMSFLLVLFSVLICTFFIARKKYVQTITESETRYRSIVENSQDAILLLSREGVLETMNEAGYRRFKIPPGTTNLQAGELFSSSSPPLCFTAPDIFNSERLKSEISFVLKDGTRFIGEIVPSSYRDGEGVEKLIIQVRDVSFRKEMEQRLLKEQKRYQRRLTKLIILAQEREREVIGHELHDNVNQILTTVKLFLETARSYEDMREELLPKSIHLIQDCIAEIRNLSHALSSPTLGTQSLIDSIKALVENVNVSGRYSISFNYDDYHTSLEKDQRLAIYRILQEQLNNIIKHAGATKICICLSQENGFTELTINDDGRGFDPEAARGGIGFNNMRSRAKAFGGRFLVESSPGYGCTLSVLLPVQAAEENLIKEVSL